MQEQTAVRAYRTRPVPPEIQKKVAISYTESLDLNERELKCPYCGRYVGSLFSDSAGHFKSKCPHCKSVTVYNLGYFRRQHYRRK